MTSLKYYNKTKFDIGLGKNLGPNQARVLLEWDGS